MSPLTLPVPYMERLADLATFRVVIVGKDPYPNDAMGIPFCKPDWSQMKNWNTSGLHVLRSLGINVERESQRYDSPSELFTQLSDEGIAFLNVSYQYIGGKIVRKRHLSHLLDAHKSNAPILKKSKLILLCGEANKMRWVADAIPGSENVIHPDIRNTTRETRRIRWEAIWESDRLRARLNP